MPDPKDGFLRFIRREPLGVVFTIAPWNYPYLTAVNSIIPAIDGGQYRGAEARRQYPAGG